MLDAIAYTPEDVDRNPRRNRLDADLYATIERMLRRDRAERDGDGRVAVDLGGASLSTLMPSPGTMEIAADGGPVDLTAPFNRPMLGMPPVRRWTPGETDMSRSLGGLPEAGDGGGGGGTPSGVSIAAASAPPTGGIPGFGFGIGTTVAGVPAGIGVSPTNVSIGARAGPVGISASPISGVGVKASTGIPALDAALGLASVPMGVNLAQGVMPTLGAFTGPLGLAIAGFNGLVALAEGGLNAAAKAGFQGNALGKALTAAFGLPNITANALNAMDPVTSDAAKARTALALGAALTSNPTAVPGIVANSNFAAQLAANLGLAVHVDPTTLSGFGVAVPTAPPGTFGVLQGLTSLYSGFQTTNFGRGSDADDASDATGASAGPVGPGSSSSGVPGSADNSPGGDGGGPGGGPGPGDGPGDAGQAPFLATWAMQGLGIGADERRQRGWAAFHRSFTKRFPLTGESQFRRYARLARQIVDVLERQPVEEQRRVQRAIYHRIVAPLGETLELHEVDEAWTAMRQTALALARRYKLAVDPADIPQPAHEIAARARKVRQERVAKLRAAADSRGDS